MLKRIKNLIKLSKYEPKDNGEEVKLEPSETDKPKGKARIIDLEEPIDLLQNND